MSWSTRRGSGRGRPDGPVAPAHDRRAQSPPGSEELTRMKYGSTFTVTRRLIGATALVGAVLIGSGQTAGATVSKLEPISPSRVATVAETKCGPAAPGIRCGGW